MDKEKEYKIRVKRFSNGKSMSGHVRSHLSNSKSTPMSMPKPIPMINHDRPHSTLIIGERRLKQHRDERRDEEAEMSMEDSEAALCLLMMRREGRKGVKEENASHKRMNNYNGYCRLPKASVDLNRPSSYRSSDYDDDDEEDEQICRDEFSKVFDP